MLAAVTNNTEAFFFASKDLKDNPAFMLAAARQDVSALEFASNRLKDDPAFLQCSNMSYAFLIKALSALAMSAAVLAVGVLILGSVLVPPVAPVTIGAGLTLAGIAANGFFAKKVYQHQSRVTEYATTKPDHYRVCNNKA